MPTIRTDAASHQSMHPATMQQPDEDNQKANAAWRAVHGVLLFEDAILAWGIDVGIDVGIDAQFKRRAARYKMGK